MKLLIGVDDTDNKDSRGTGYLSRQLAHLIESNNLGRVNGITRHQLYVHQDIAYTSQNSSACLDVESNQENELILYCANFLKENAAQGSDAGLCIVTWKEINDEIIDWGRSAKKEVLNLVDAKVLPGKAIFILKVSLVLKLAKLEH